MKRILGSLILALLFLFPLAGHAGVEEQISHFRVGIAIQPDATIRVTETITYDFGVHERHGIFRTIPVTYKARGGTFRLRLSDVTVTNEYGAPRPFTKPRSGGDVEIKIGDANTLVTGEHTYVISYTVDRALNYFDDHDELYWNATGNEWDIPILDAEAMVKLPSSASYDTVRVECFAGLYGAATRCDNARINADTAVFEENDLDAQEGVTIVIGFPKGMVYEPSVWERALAVARDNLIVALPLLVFVVFFWLWRARGRDPKGRGTIIPEYDAPDHLTPAEVGTIMDERVDRADISAILIHLAVQGYLDITREEKRFGRDDYLFQKLKSEDSLANDFEKTLLKKMFGKKTDIRLSDLKEKFHDDLAQVKKQLYQSVVSKGYATSNPTTVRALYVSIGIIVFITGLALGRPQGVIPVVSIILSSIIILIFALVMPKRTAKGVRAKEHALGLKMYLTVAEKDRLAFHNAPKKDPKQFEALLPYAMALGVEKEWAKQFEGLESKPPSWYHDAPGHTFSTLYFASAMSNFGSRAGSVMASRPSSAAGGGSGLGGGGFSGGGGGGGGGGSW